MSQTAPSGHQDSLGADRSCYIMWKSVCCEVQGTGHKRNQVPCQDKTFELVQNGVHVIALADGAGSASLSHYGAERVVKDASEYIAAHFQEYLNCDDGREVKQAFLKMLQNGLSEEAQIRKCGIRDLSSTLLLAAVDENHFILAHIGDGVIGYLDGDRLKVASMPDNGEFSNVTTFVTSDEALISMRLFKGELKDKDAFVLMSDGTEQSLYHKPTKTLAGIVVKLMHRTCLTGSETMRVQLEDAFTSVISKNTQDDCSIAILARPSAVLCPIDTLGFKERQELYGIKGRECCVHKRVNRCDTILTITEAPCSLIQIARKIHLNPKYTRKYIDRLIALGLLVKKKSLYQKV